MGNWQLSKEGIHWPVSHDCNAGAGVTLGNLSTRRSWFTSGMAGRELDRGRGLRAKCKSLSKTTWNHPERRQNNSVENVFHRFTLSFISFLRRKHDLRERISTFVWRILFENPEFEPLRSTWELAFEIRDRSSRTTWHAQWLSCYKNTSGWRPWYQERLVLKFPIHSPLKKQEGNRNRNASRNGFWDRYWRHTGQLLVTI